MANYLRFLDRKGYISICVKLIIGFIFKDEGVSDKAKIILVKRFGNIDYESEPIAFTHTDYYKEEFGDNLKRSFISFENLISPRGLAQIKNITNIIERRLSKRGSRLINIDPGYLDMAKLILASTKDYRHRIYLGKGIYAEVTLFYRGKSFMPWEWTYPDYKTADYIAIFNQIRGIYVKQIKGKP